MKKQTVNYFKMQIPSSSVNESFARKVCSDFVMMLDPTLSELSDVRTAVSEAVTNCIVHAYKDKCGTIYISGKIFDDSTVEIKIKDHGCGIEDVKKAMEPLYTTDTSGERGGMGFAIMSSFTDKLNIRSSIGKGTTVTMTKRIKNNANDI